MGSTVCLLGNAIHYLQGGGHLWVYLNWALGFRAMGCNVIWLEIIDDRIPVAERGARIGAMKTALEPYGLQNCLAVSLPSSDPIPAEMAAGCMGLDDAVESELLVNMHYGADARIVSRFRRTALLDIDPGLLQLWMTQGLIKVEPHDHYFTIGENVGQPHSKIPDAGLIWHYTPPCVTCLWWPVQQASGDAAFTTISHWNTSDEWMRDADNQEVYSNDKKVGFEPFLDLPQHTEQPMELALALFGDKQERQSLEACGWIISDACRVASTPWAYQQYIQRSRGEFSCVKPSCVRLQNAWISDRTICYLASGKPAVVQHTGPSRFLPDREGLCRFRTFDEAVKCLEDVAGSYTRHSAAARTLAEEYFDAVRVVPALLERALD